MEVIKLGLIAVLLLSNIICQEFDGNWREGIREMKWPNTDLIQDILVRMTRKPKLRQYFGFKGKKGGKMQTARKRHKFQTFVGLMGKRNSN